MTRKWIGVTITKLYVCLPLNTQHTVTVQLCKSLSDPKSRAPCLFDALTHCGTYLVLINHLSTSQDPSTKLREAVDALGGVVEVMADEDKMCSIMEQMDLKDQITVTMVRDTYNGQRAARKHAKVSWKHAKHRLQMHMPCCELSNLALVHAAITNHFILICIRVHYQKVLEISIASLVHTTYCPGGCPAPPLHLTFAGHAGG